MRHAKQPGHPFDSLGDLDIAALGLPQLHRAPNEGLAIVLNENDRTAAVIHDGGRRHGRLRFAGGSRSRAKTVWLMARDRPELDAS